MLSIRERLIRRFPCDMPVREPDDAVAHALWALLWPVGGENLSVDGWSFFRVMSETDDAIGAVGLMTLLPSGSVPIAIDLARTESGFSWWVRVAAMDREWMALSDSKRWNSVYLHAAGDRETPDWTWERKYDGFVECEGARS